MVVIMDKTEAAKAKWRSTRAEVVAAQETGDRAAFKRARARHARASVALFHMLGKDIEAYNRATG